jgi:hypothetical protein
LRGLLNHQGTGIWSIAPGSSAKAPVVSRRRLLAPQKPLGVDRDRPTARQPDQAGRLLIGITATLALAVLSGALSFVPYIGPITAVVPALLIAIRGWPWEPLWLLVVYVGVQFLEGNLITPFVQFRAGVS